MTISRAEMANLIDLVAHLLEEENKAKGRIEELAAEVSRLKKRVEVLGG